MTDGVDTEVSRIVCDGIHNAILSGGRDSTASNHLDFIHIASIRRRIRKIANAAQGPASSLNRKCEVKGVNVDHNG